MSQDYYVYTHSLPEQPPFYVGKGQLHRTKKIARPHNKHHTNIVNKYGKDTIIVRSMLCKSETHALELEVKMIAALRAGRAKLVNLTDGGEGMSNPSPETRAKLSAAQRNRTPESRARATASNKGKKRSPEFVARMTGVRRSPEAIANMIAAQNTPEMRTRLSAARKGRIVSAEAAEKTAKANRGRKNTAEAIARMSAAQKLAQGTPEARAKKSAALMGVKHTDATRAKMSATRKGRKHSPEHIAAAAAGRKRASQLRKQQEKANA